MCINREAKSGITGEELMVVAGSTFNIPSMLPTDLSMTPLIW